MKESLSGGECGMKQHETERQDCGGEIEKGFVEMTAFRSVQGVRLSGEEMAVRNGQELRGLFLCAG